MIRINYVERFELEDSRPGTDGNHKILFTSGERISKHWGWEFNCYRNNLWFKLDFSLKTRTDHQGLFMSFAFLKYEFEFLVYDGRHRDYENDCPETAKKGK